MIPFINLKAQYESIKSEIDQAVLSVLQSGHYIGGNPVSQFESEFAAINKSSDCIGVGNGTDAILIALKSLGVQRGDEIIIPAFGWLSAGEMVTLAGGVPVFCDVLASGTIDPAQIKSKITGRTKGVILIHLYGQAAEARRIAEICSEHQLFLIEDCAQAHLTSENGFSAGTIGDAGTFSFYPTKNLGAYGDGGCIITNNSALGKRMRSYSNHGGLGVHELEGINSRLDTIQAAILSVKLRKLTAWTTQRIKHAGLYIHLLRDCESIILPAVRMDTVHTFHQFVIRSNKRDALKAFLEENQIQTLIHYGTAIHRLPAYRYLNHEPGDFPVSTACAEEVLSLPLYPELQPEQIEFVCGKVNLFFKR